MKDPCDRHRVMSDKCATRVRRQLRLVTPLGGNNSVKSTRALTFPNGTGLLPTATVLDQFIAETLMIAFAALQFGARNGV